MEGFQNKSDYQMLFNQYFELKPLTLFFFSNYFLCGRRGRREKFFQGFGFNRDIEMAESASCG